jgi:RNA polymerase sigma factor (sigma-70 family)
VTAGRARSMLVRVTGETGFGAGGRDFPETSWSLVVRLGARGEDRQLGLSALCQRYWRPIYSYARQGLRREREDAKELTQAFFLWLIEGQTLERYAPEQASFRHYLKGLLRNFARNEVQARERLKRGGGVASLPLDDAALPGLEASLADPKATSPEEAFDRAFTADLLERALARVREAEGDSVRFAAYAAYELGPPGAQPTYADVAAQLGVKPGDVRNHLFAVRERLRAEVRAELEATVSDRGQVDDEWRALFGG